jgi:hypothetical protein
MDTLCYFCNEPIQGEVHHHHPDKAQHPNWVEPAHPACHTRYHSEAGHFQEWGGWTQYKGRQGYELAIKKWPGFHRMGGLARAKAAHRNELGRFT